MAWWDGTGAARVLCAEDGALLMERAMGLGSLSDMACFGRDDEASTILCQTAARLHAPRPGPFPILVPLEHWFRALASTATTPDSFLSRCNIVSRELMASPQKDVPLHGDLHHGNMLDFGSRGWLAIDPKCLVVERGFEFANIFCDPDLSLAIEPERFRRRAAVVTKVDNLNRKRLLLWILAWCGLLSAFFLEDGDAPPIGLSRVAELAAAELDR